MSDDDLADFEQTEFTHDGKTRAVYRKGSGPAVIVIAEMPGITPKVLAFARQVAEIGCPAVLPHLFHRLGSPVFVPTNRADDVLAEAVVRANDATSLQGSAMDTRAIMDFAAAGGFGIRTGLWGAIGYCMGGRHALSAAATR